MVIMPQSGLWIADWNKITRIIAVVLFCLGLLVLIFYLTGVL